MLFTSRFRPIRALTISLVLLIVSILCIGNPPALAVPDITNAPVTPLENPKYPTIQKPEALQKRLELSPIEDRYQGVEYASQSVQRRSSDREILHKIKSTIIADVVARVSDGFVHLSGQVENRETARAIIDQVKRISGVYEVTFDLGFNAESCEDSRTP